LSEHAIPDSSKDLFFKFGHGKFAYPPILGEHFPANIHIKCLGLWFNPQIFGKKTSLPHVVGQYPHKMLCLIALVVSYMMSDQYY
jgi:hypothetical protein